MAVGEYKEQGITTESGPRKDAANLMEYSDRHKESRDTRTGSSSLRRPWRRPEENDLPSAAMRRAALPASSLT
jgi:hypothetical protein